MKDKRKIILMIICLVQILIIARLVKNRDFFGGYERYDTEQVRALDANGVEWIDDGTFRCAGDSYFVLPIDDGYVFDVKVTFDQPVKQGAVSVYLDHGTGFQEKYRIFGDLTQESIVGINSTKKVYNIRLDIEGLSKQDTLGIKSIEVEGCDGVAWLIIFAIMVIAILAYEYKKCNISLLELAIKYAGFLWAYKYMERGILLTKGKTEIFYILAMTAFIALIADYKYQEKDHFYIILPIACFCLFTVWASIQPFNGGPDEAMRYDVCNYIYKYWKLPHGGEELIRNPVWGISYAFNPIVNYVFCAIAMKLFGFMVAAERLFIIARMVSVCFSIGTIIFVGKIGRKLFDEKYAKLFTLLFALWPQFMFISTYVNNDSMGIFSVVFIFYTMLEAKEKQWNLKSCIWMGVAIGVCLLSYTNCYGMIIVALLYSIYGVVKCQDIDNKFKYIMVRILWVMIPALIVAGWWFVRNAILYDGDFLGMATSNKYGEMYAVEAFKPSNRETPSRLKETLWYTLVERGWIDLSTKSFYGWFGPMQISLPYYIYSIVNVMIFTGIIGNFMINNNKNGDVLSASTVLCVITFILSVYYSYCCDYQPQGRYMLPMLVGIGVLVVNGWKNIFANMSDKTEKIAIYVLVMLIITCSIYCCDMILSIY